MKNNLLLLLLCLLSTLSYRCWGLIPLIDGGKGMPSESNLHSPLVIHDDLHIANAIIICVISLESPLTHHHCRSK